MADGGRMGADRRTAAGGRTGGGRANRWTWGKGEADGRTGGGRADGRTARRMEADGRTSRGFKRPRTSFSTSLSSAQTTRLTTERVCRALGSALES